MLDFNPVEFLVVAVVALLVIGPKDLPKAMRVLGYWVGKARGAARQFRSGFDAMVREAELAEMEKKWKAENERIMREYPPEPVPNGPDPIALPAPEAAEPVMVAQPEIVDAAEAPPAEPEPARPAAKRKPRAKAAS